MRLVAANLGPFDLGEVTASPSVLSALCRGLILLPPPGQRRDEIIAAIQTIAKTAQADEDAILVFRTIGRAVRIPKSRDQEAAG